MSFIYSNETDFLPVSCNSPLVFSIYRGLICVHIPPTVQPACCHNHQLITIMESRCATSFCVKVGDSATWTCGKLQKDFGDLPVDVEDDSNRNKVRELVRADRRLTELLLRRIEKLFVWSWLRIWEWEWFVPKLYPETLRRDVSADLLEQVDSESSLLNGVITRNESRFYQYVLKTKRLWNWALQLHQGQNR